MCRSLRFAALAALTLGAIAVRAQEPAATVDAKATREAPSEDFSRVSGLFDVDLPKTVEKYNVRLLTHPHFGDFLHRSYVRVPVGVRLGLNQRTELNGEVESFLTHGLKGSGPGFGVGALRFGAKYQWAHWLKPIVDTSTGFNVAFPVGRPPVDMTDGHVHATPYVTFSRRIDAWPKATPFVSLGVDLVRSSSVPGTFGRNQPRSDTNLFSAGFLYNYSKTFTYTLVAGYNTTALIGEGSNHYFSLNPSILWQLPPWLTLGSKDRWIIGFGLKVNHGPDGWDTSTSAKLRGEFRFARWFRR